MFEITGGIPGGPIIGKPEEAESLGEDDRP
jgi:hypothetical protein